MENAFLHEFVRIANQQHPLRAAALQCQCKALDDIHVGHTLHEAFPLYGIRLDFDGRFFDFFHGDGAFLHLVQHGSLFGIGGRRAAHRDDELRIGYKALQVIQQGLNSFRRETRCYARDHRGRAGRVLRQRISDASLFRQVFSAIEEKVWVCVRPGRGGKKVLGRLGQENVLRAFGNCRVRIDGEDGEQLDPVFRAERDTTGAERELLFRTRTTGADLFA